MFFSIVILRKIFIWTNPLILYQRDKRTMRVILKGPYVILSTLDSIKPSWLIYGFIRPLYMSEDQHGDYVPYVNNILLTKNNLGLIKTTKK